MNRLAIFDCDGTLVDSGATIHRALDRALAAHGVECPPPHIARKVIRLSLEQAVAELVPDGDHDAISRTYRDTFIAMRGAGDVDEPLVDGIGDLIDAFEADGWLLGVATGKSRRASTIACAAMAWRGVSRPCKRRTAIAPSHTLKWR